MDTSLLWVRLIDELNDVFDAHGVCAGAALAIAEFANTVTLVALSEPMGDHYNVWISEPDGTITQDRWGGETASLEAISRDAGSTVYDRFEVPAGELVRSELWQLASETILACPLPFPTGRGQLSLPGAVCLLDPGRLCPVTAAALEPLAAQISVFLDRAFLRQRSDQQAIEFGIVSDIGYSITSTFHLPDIVLQVTDAVRRALGAESIVVGLTNDESSELVFLDSITGRGSRREPPFRLEIGQGIAGWVALHGEPAIVNDTQRDQRYSGDLGAHGGYDAHSVLCVPLQIEQRTIGVLEAINKNNARFDENDSRLLQAISGPLAVSVENARLHSDVLAEKRRVETIFSSMSEGLLTTNSEGLITACNSALLNLLGKEGHDLGGKRVDEVIHTRPSDFGEFVEQVRGAEVGFPQLASDLYQGDLNYVPVLVSGTSIRQEDGAVDELIFVFSDLRQIREVERMRDDFFTNIVHELRTPLATILMYARLLREGRAKGDPQKADRFLGVVERESDRLQKMVRQMLELAKLEASVVQPGVESALPNLVLEQVLPPLADRASEKGLTFKQHVRPDLPAVTINEETLYMILKNLVENAIKFTPSGSVSVEALQERERVRVEVADQGIGIPQEALPNLFQRYFRAQTAVERGIAGTGLGLYMVKEGLEKHGGSIEVRSETGRGTAFTVYLPLASAQD